MRTPSLPESKLDDLARYAPKWARDPANVERRPKFRLGQVDGMARASGEGSIRRVESALNEFKKSLVIDGFEVPPSLVPSLDPRPVPQPWALPRTPRRSTFARIARSVAVVALAANVALLLVWQLPVEGRVREFAKSFGPISSPPPERPAAASQRPASRHMPPKIAEVPSAAPVMTALVAERSAPKMPPKIAEAPSAAPVMAMAAPEPPAAEPPAGAGQEVSPPTTDKVVSSSVAFKTTATDDSVRRAEPLRRIDPDEVQFLFQRGEEFVAAGDFAAARIVFERAAEAGHARAAFALAAIYDPLVHRRFGIKSLTADLAKAREWYEKAGSLGSPEASRRIDLLANLEN